MPARRLSVSEYQTLIHSGHFAHDENFELLEGWMVPKMSRNPPHDLSMTLVLRFLGKLLPANWFCRPQAAITTADSQPEPDVAVVLGPERRYGDHHPGPAEIAIVVEAADSTLADDRNVKGGIYARAGIEVYWIVNLVDRCVEVYTEPTGSGENARYRAHEVFSNGQSLPWRVGGGDCGTIAVADLLP
jgi:Uma2 family endonuclease